ncbi:MAG: PAS domain-containing protein [Actinomycetia bacterium]|nr:PAS domain-containing protein [Actinomycetes bacterium]
MEEASWLDNLTEIVDTVPAGIIVYNADGQAVFANPEAGRIFGVSRVSLLGRLFNDPQWRFTDLDGTSFTDADHCFSVSMQTGQSTYGIDQVVELPDRARVILSVNAAPLRTKERGEIVAVIKSFIDVTQTREAQKALAQSEYRYRTLTEAAADPIYIVDSSDTLKYVNKAGANLIKKEQADLIGRPVSEIFRQQTAKMFHVHRLEAMEAGKPMSFEESFKSDGKEIWMETKIVPMREPDGRIDSIVGISRDVTSRKRKK